MRKIEITLKIFFLIILTYATFIPIFRANNYLFVKEVSVIQETITEQREIANSVELTALVDTIIDTNKKIAKLKSYQKLNILKPFFCTEFAEIDFVK